MTLTARAVRRLVLGSDARQMLLERLKGDITDIATEPDDPYSVVGRRITEGSYFIVGNSGDQHRDDNPKVPLTSLVWWSPFQGWAILILEEGSVPTYEWTKERVVSLLRQFRHRWYGHQLVGGLSRFCPLEPIRKQQTWIALQSLTYRPQKTVACSHCGHVKISYQEETFEYVLVVTGFGRTVVQADWLVYDVRTKPEEVATLREP